MTDPDEHRAAAKFVVLLASAVCAVLAVSLCYAVASSLGGLAASLQPLAVGSLSLVVVAGARLLEGPVLLGTKRRGQQPHSGGVAVILMWLACFGALEAAFLLASVSRLVPALTNVSYGDNAEDVSSNTAAATIASDVGLAQNVVTNSTH
jgi:hypothetical protein